MRRPEKGVLLTIVAVFATSTAAQQTAGVDRVLLQRSPCRSCPRHIRENQPISSRLLATISFECFICARRILAAFGRDAQAAQLIQQQDN